jgi:hypothetical protein
MIGMNGDGNRGGYRAGLWEADSLSYVRPRYDRREGIDIKGRNEVWEYEALVLESNILALSKPSFRTLRTFNRWFEASAVLLLGAKIRGFSEMRGVWLLWH